MGGGFVAKSVESRCVEGPVEWKVPGIGDHSDDRFLVCGGKRIGICMGDDLEEEKEDCRE